MWTVDDDDFDGDDDDDDFNDDDEFFVVTPLSFPVRRIGTAVNCKLKKPRQEK